MKLQGKKKEKKRCMDDDQLWFYWSMLGFVPKTKE